MANVILTVSNNSTVQPFAGGVTSIADKNLITRISFNGAWNVNDSYTFNINTQALTYSAGKGNVTLTKPVHVITLYNKVNFISDNRWFFSDNEDASAWEQQNAGAGRIVLSNQFAMPENLVSLTQYQGMMCVQSRRTTQIWQISPDPNSYALFQTLANIGCFASLGANALGDLDVVFPYDSGIRSLRSRDVTLNATPSDIGSAVDEFVGDNILGLDESQLASCCAIIEPEQNRYWLFIPNSNGSGGVIYVLSYFPNNKIVAWSRYYTTTEVKTDYPPDSVGPTIVQWTNLIVGNSYYWEPTVSNVLSIDGKTYTTAGYVLATSNTATAIFVGGTFNGHLYSLSQTNFTPQKFAVMQGQVYIRDASAIYVYGGVDNNTFDSSQAVIQLPFYDEKRPGHEKEATHIDCDVEGNWTVYGSPDWINNTWQNLAPIGMATFDQGNFPFQDKGTHFSFMLQSTAVEYSKVSALVFYYQLGAEPPS